MKNLIALFTLCSLIACGKAAPGASVTSTAPVTPVIVDPNAPPTPAPAPVNSLSCHISTFVYCSNGNMGSGTATLNMTLMFIGNFSGGSTATVTSVVNNVTSPGGIPHSVCVYADVNNGASTFNQVICGNAVDPTSAYRTLVFQ